MRQFRAVRLKTESGVDFKGDSGFLSLYMQHIFKNQPWLLRESGETARNLHAHRSIVNTICASTRSCFRIHAADGRFTKFFKPDKLFHSDR